MLSWSIACPRDCAPAVKGLQQRHMQSVRVECLTAGRSPQCCYGSGLPQPISTTRLASCAAPSATYAPHQAPSAAAGSIHHDCQQLSGMRMPVMQQLQRNQQELQHQVQQATAHVQQGSLHSVHHHHHHQQQSMQQQQVQRPTLFPKPGTSSTDVGGHARQLSSSPDLPRNIWAIQQLRNQIAAATTIQELLQLLPAVAADKNPDVITRLLLQAVHIHRSSTSSIVDEKPWENKQHTAEMPADAIHHPQQRQLWQLLQQCDALLLRCGSRLMFQHASGVLWSWAQLHWRTAAAAAASEDTGDGDQLLWHVVDRLKECKVDQELSGKVPSAGAQLARATTACAKLHITSRRVWAKLQRMTQALAHTLNPSEVACCCWGLARSRQTAKTKGALAAYTALLIRAQQIVRSCHRAGGGGGSDDQGLAAVHQLGFSRVGALNVIWAVCIGGVVDAAPAGLMEGLLQLVLGQQYSNRCQQRPCSATPAAEAAADAARSNRLLPHELACLVWSVAVAARHKSRTEATHQWQQHPHHSSNTRSSMQQSPAVQPLFSQDSWLIDHLVEVTKEQLITSSSSRGLRPRQVASLAYGFAILLQHQQPQQQCEGLQQRLLKVVALLWQKAGAGGPYLDLASFKLTEVSMLLESVAATRGLQQQPQLQQPPGNISAAGRDMLEAAAAVLAAASRRILSAGEEELQVHTAAVLLYATTKLQRSVSATVVAENRDMLSGASGSYTGSRGCSHVVEDGAAVAVKLLSSLTSSRLGCLRDRELVMLGVAAGELAAVAPTSSSSLNLDETSSSSSRAHGNIVGMQAAAISLLNQLSLPLAASAHTLGLRKMATAVCGYAAANIRAPHLFDAVSREVQRREVLDRGSTWGLARLLAAYATVGHTDERLFAAVVDALMPKLDVLRPGALARFSWALAESGYHDLEVFRAIAAQIMRRSGSAPLGYTARGNTSTESQRVLVTAQGVAVDSSIHQGVDTATPHSTEKRAAEPGPAGVLDGFAPRDIAALAWALGTVGVKDPKPFQALTNTALIRLTEFTVSQLANLLWGLAVAGVYHERLVTQLTALIGGGGFGDGSVSVDSQQQQSDLPALLQGASAADVATLAWSLSELRCVSPAVLQACAVHFISSTEQYRPVDAADLAWALLASGCAVPWVARRATSTSTSSGRLSAQVMERVSSNQQCSNATHHTWDIPALLEELLLVVLADLDQLTPQQLANSMLVAAVAEAVAAEPSQASDTGQQQQQQLQHQWQQLMLSTIAGWGAGAFTAADGAKLLWAHMLLGGLNTRPQQQQLPPQQQHLHQTAVLQKLLSAGARAAVYTTMLVCSGSFCGDVLAVISSIDGVTAQPAVTAAAAATAAKQAASAVPGVLAPASREASAAVEAAADSVPPAAALIMQETTVSTGANPALLWGDLGRKTTAQLLGHLVVNTTAAASAGVVDGESAQREVLLLLVPNSHLGRTNDLVDRDVSSDVATTETATQAAAAAGPKGWLCNVTGSASVVAGLLLPYQSCYSEYCVVTEAQWQQWAAAGGREAQAAAMKSLLLDM